MKVFTIGYAGKKFDEFLSTLKKNKINAIIDVRRFPSSKYPEFNKEFLQQELPKHGIAYFHLEGLGGFRRGYEDHMQTSDFKRGMEKLMKLIQERVCCILCLERKVKYCHRRFISDWLKSKGVNVVHL
jgi:uncharacterized protein (DUF488 family)